MIRESLWLMTTSNTTLNRGSVTVEGMIRQLAPPSVDFITPMPALGIGGRLFESSPVPTYRTSGSFGSIAIAETATWPNRSVIGFHVAPASVDLKTPPATPPVYITAGFRGWMT